MHIHIIGFSEKETKRLQKTVPRLCEIVLEDDCSKINTLHIVRTLPVLNWRYGFLYLWYPKNQFSEIRLPADYTNQYYIEYLIAHELVHIRQLMSGELKLLARLNHYEIEFRGKSYVSSTSGATWRDMAGHRYFVNDSQGDIPWEKEPIEKANMCLKLFQTKKLR